MHKIVVSMHTLLGLNATEYANFSGKRARLDRTFLNFAVSIFFENFKFIVLLCCIISTVDYKGFQLRVSG